MPAALAKSARGKRLRILVIDVGANHVKLQLNTPRRRREFRSGPKLTAEAMVTKVKDLTEAWTYQVASGGYPGPVAGNRPIADPYNLGSGWAGFDFLPKCFIAP